MALGSGAAALSLTTESEGLRELDDGDLAEGETQAVRSQRNVEWEIYNIPDTTHGTAIYAYLHWGGWF